MTAEQEGGRERVFDVVTVAAGDRRSRCHVVFTSGLAFVVDPPADTAVVEEVLDRRRAPLVLVAETHAHHSGATPGRALATARGAHHTAPAPTGAALDGDDRHVGALVVRAISTPGHTAEHLSYVVIDDGGPIACFTGGSVLRGDVGVVGSDDGEGSVLGAAQYRSAHRLLGMLPPDVLLLPGHGRGEFSFAGKATAGAATTGLSERRHNPVYTAASEFDFVARIVRQRAEAGRSEAVGSIGPGAGEAADAADARRDGVEHGVA